MKSIKSRALAALFVVAGLGLSACSTNDVPSAKSESKDALVVVATTGYLGDAVNNIAPDADVTVLVGPGGDPHTQELTTKDTEKINSADLVVWTSHDMEHKMMDQLDKLGERQIPAAETIPESDLLPWEEDGQIQGHDPHVWNSPDNWKYAVTAIGEKLAEIDPANADTYKQNAENYNQKIDEAKAEAGELLTKIPKDRRILVTGHDAFNYLGATYDMEIYATDLVSSESEISAAELDELAEMIAKRKVPVIFQDNLKNPEAINHLTSAVKAKGGQVEVFAQPLYADSLGEEAPVNTYLGVFTYNARAIAEALSQ